MNHMEIYWEKNKDRYGNMYRLENWFIMKGCTPILKIKCKGNYEISINFINIQNKDLYFESYVYNDSYKNKNLLKITNDNPFIESIECVKPDYFDTQRFLKSDRSINLKYDEKKTNLLINKMFRPPHLSQKNTLNLFPNLFPSIKDEVIEDLKRTKIKLEKIFDQKLKFSSTIRIPKKFIIFELPTIGVEDWDDNVEVIQNTVVKKDDKEFSKCCICGKKNQKIKISFCKYCFKRICIDGNCSIKCCECKELRCKNCGFEKCPLCMKWYCKNKHIYNPRNKHYSPGLGPLYICYDYSTKKFHCPRCLFE